MPNIAIASYTSDRPQNGIGTSLGLHITPALAQKDLLAQARGLVASYRSAGVVSVLAEMGQSLDRQVRGPPKYPKCSSLCPKTKIMWAIMLGTSEVQVRIDGASPAAPSRTVYPAEMMEQPLLEIERRRSPSGAVLGACGWSCVCNADFLV